jgi:hypothetical protein
MNANLRILTGLPKCRAPARFCAPFLPAMDDLPVRLMIDGYKRFSASLEANAMRLAISR